MKLQIFTEKRGTNTEPSKNDQYSKCPPYAASMAPMLVRSQRKGTAPYLKRYLSDKISFGLEDVNRPQIRGYVLQGCMDNHHWQNMIECLRPSFFRKLKFRSGIDARFHGLGADEEDKQVTVLNLHPDSCIKFGTLGEGIPIKENVVPARGNSQGDIFSDNHVRPLV